MFLKIIGSVGLVIGILVVSLVSNSLVARTWLVAKTAAVAPAAAGAPTETTATEEPSCVIFGQPWPEWKWANTPWLSPPCDRSKNPDAGHTKTNDVAKPIESRAQPPLKNLAPIGEITPPLEKSQ